MWLVGLAIVVLIALWIAAATGKLIREEKARLAAEEAGRQRELSQQREAHAYEQNFKATQLEQFSELAVGAFVSIPAELLEAERCLDQAEQEYRERAFAPFWTAIEGSLNALGKVDQRIRQISSCASSYYDDAVGFEGEVATFPVATVDSVKFGKCSKLTRERMQRIVRDAQTDFQFATIYEQRRTNDILIAGFNNLSAAIYGLGDRLTSSIEGLTEQVARMEQGQQARHIEAVAHADASLVQLAAFHEAAARQRSAIDAVRSNEANRQILMLDNLQRNRKPDAHERGPRII